MPFESSAHHMSPRGSGLYTPAKPNTRKTSETICGLKRERAHRMWRYLPYQLWSTMQNTEEPNAMSIHFPVGVLSQQMQHPETAVHPVTGWGVKLAFPVSSWLVVTRVIPGEGIICAQTITNKNNTYFLLCSSSVKFLMNNEALKAEVWLLRYTA